MLKKSVKVESREIGGNERYINLEPILLPNKFQLPKAEQT